MFGKRSKKKISPDCDNCLFRKIVQLQRMPSPYARTSRGPWKGKDITVEDILKDLNPYNHRNMCCEDINDN